MKQVLDEISTVEAVNHGRVLDMMSLFDKYYGDMKEHAGGDAGAAAPPFDEDDDWLNVQRRGD